MSSQRAHKLTEAETGALLKAKRIIEAFRKVDHKMPASYIAAFLAVALEPSKGPTHYAKAIGTIQPIASRLLLEIGPKARHKDEPLGLVDKEVSAHSLRDHEYFLTPKGKALMGELTAIMGA